MNKEIIFKQKPSIEYLKLNIEGNPVLLENTAELYSKLGDGIGVVGCILTWDFKVYETLSNNRLLINSRITQEHRFKMFSGLTLSDVEDVVSESHNESRQLLQIELKKNEVQYLSSDLPEDYLQKVSRLIFEDVKKLLY